MSSDAPDTGDASRLFDNVNDWIDHSGEYAMAAVDFPNEMPVIMVAQKGQELSRANTHRMLGLCQPVPNHPTEQSDITGISPVVMARNYFWRYEKRRVDGPVTIEVLTPPKFGKLVAKHEKLRQDDGTYNAEGRVYLPNKHFYGTDSTVLLVQIGQERVKIHLLLKVIESAVAPDYPPESTELCPKNIWKISLTPGESSPYDSLHWSVLADGATVIVGDLPSWMRSAVLDF